ncbi:hypothetical protein, partial [Pseudomonas syringae group genomosp. 3]|uniref:hypothetical protein n=1 Tax=Pseudomonas syringae group genomosp. 3 TaxID=251701 RepID=UPI001C3F471A
HQHPLNGSTLFRLFLRLFLARQRHGLLKGITYFVQAFIVQIMNASGALGAKIDQFAIVAHGCAVPGHVESAPIMLNSIGDDQSET